MNTPQTSSQPDRERAAARARFAITHLGGDCPEPQSASSDASFRSYWRISAAGRSFLVMDAPPEREDVRPWLDIAHRLRTGGLHAPAVLAQDLEQGFLLIEDFGNRTLLAELDETSVGGHYARAMRDILCMQQNVDYGELPVYDASRLATEMELMPTWFLQRHLGLSAECHDWQELELCFTRLIGAALIQPQVFVHRDFHSRNLMLLEDNELGLIDFQDALRGPLTYDLVSLLRDCYIAWPEDRVYAWVENFRQQAVKAGLTDIDATGFARWFDLIGLQRHIKVLGIFCRLCYRDGKSGYLQDLPLVWQYTASVGARHPETRALVERMSGIMGERDLTRPNAQQQVSG